eukprot:1437296-Amphidinium_carterae.1
MRSLLLSLRSRRLSQQTQQQSQQPQQLHLHPCEFIKFELESQTLTQTELRIHSTVDCSSELSQGFLVI